MRVLGRSLAAGILLDGVPALASAALANSIRFAAASATTRAVAPEERQEATADGPRARKRARTPKTLGSVWGRTSRPGRTPSYQQALRRPSVQTAIPHVAAFAAMPGRPLPDWRVLAADIDDTITTGGKLPGALLELFEKLEAAGLVVAWSPGAAQRGRRP